MKQPLVSINIPTYNSEKKDKEFTKRLLEIEEEYSGLGYGNDEKNYFVQQKKRYNKLYNILKKILNKNDKILDVGCYPGHFTLCLKKSGYDIIGIDKNPKRNFKFLLNKNLKIEECDIEKEKLPFKNDMFNKILFTEVFEHLYHNPIFTLQELKRVLKSDGKLILATPNGYSIKRMVHFFLGKGFGPDPFEEFNLYISIGHHGHIKEYVVNELKIFLKNIGFNIESISFVYYDEHYRFRNNPLISFSFRLFYKIFYFFRPHLIIVAGKIK